MERFPDEIVDAFDRAREIDIETVGRRTGQARRVVVWVIVDDGIPHVRSEFGDAGQWYRNALAEPRVVVRFGGLQVACRAVPVTDPAVWRTVSEAYRTKYRRSSSLGVMVQSDVEPMTLALSPDPAQRY